MVIYYGTINLIVDINESYCSCVAYLYILCSSTCRRPRVGKNNVYNFYCLLPLHLEGPKINQVARVTYRYMIDWSRKINRRKKLF